MRNFTRRILLLLSMAILGLSSAFGQAGTIEPQEITESTSSVTLKTIRALFPDQPVAVANELFGGLHSVPTVELLHGGNQLIFSDSLLQEGMLVYVAEKDMYYRYKGKDADGLNHSTQTGAAITDVLVDGVSTNYWESLASQIYTAIKDSIGNQISDSLLVMQDALADSVFSTINGDVRTLIDNTVGDVFIDADTTFVWDGDSWEVLADNIQYAESVVQGDTATTADTKEGDIVIDNNGALDTTWIYDGSDWVIASTEVEVPQVYAGTAADTSSVTGVEGDIYLGDNDTTYIFDGTNWEILTDNTPYAESVVQGDTVTTADTKEGDIVIDNNGALDTTWVYDGSDWVIASTEVEVPQVYAGTAADTSSVTGVEGDIYLGDNDTTYIFDGTNWEILTDNTPYAESVVQGDTVTTADTKEGDIVIDNNGDLDTTWVYDGSDWVIASTEAPLSQVFSGTDTSLVTTMNEGDLYLDGDTTYAYDGTTWQIISVLESGTYQVYTDLDDAASGVAPAAWLDKAKDMQAFRKQLADLDPTDLNQLTGTVKGVVIYYPAAWDDFIYSIVFGAHKVELTNGITTTTVQAGTAVDGVVLNADLDYKKVEIFSRQKTVEVD